MDRSTFEEIVDQAFDKLPDNFKQAIENVAIVVEDYPSDEIIRTMKIQSRYNLLGLYQGVPLKGRGPWYGMTAITPDKISLYQKNIEAVCHNISEIEQKIVEVLIHEIGHYFGMSEKEIREAGY